jgi:hypothetical protein
MTLHPEDLNKNTAPTKQALKNSEKNQFTWYEGIASVSSTEQYNLRDIDEQAIQIIKIIIDSVFCWRANPRPQDIALKKYFCDCLSPLNHPNGHYTEYHNLDPNPSLVNVIPFFSDRIPRTEALAVLAKLKEQYIDPRIKTATSFLAFEALLKILESPEPPKIDPIYWEQPLFGQPSWLTILSDNYKESHIQIHTKRIGAEMKIKGAFRAPNYNTLNSKCTFELECTQYTSIPELNGVTITLDRFRQPHDLIDLFSEEEAKLKSRSIQLKEVKPISSLFPPITKREPLQEQPVERENPPSPTKAQHLDTTKYLCEAILHRGLSGKHLTDAKRILEKFALHGIVAPIKREALSIYLSGKDRDKKLTPKSANAINMTIKALCLILSSCQPDTPNDEILKKLKALNINLPIPEGHLSIHLDEAPELEIA